jgi:hypothetical protein
VLRLCHLLWWGIRAGVFLSMMTETQALVYSMQGWLVASSLANRWPVVQWVGERRCPRCGK